MDPEIGDIVIFVNGDQDMDTKPFGFPDVREHPAIVTRVVAPGTLNMQIFFDGTDLVTRAAVPMLPEGSAPLPYATWRLKKPPAAPAAEEPATPNG